MNGRTNSNNNSTMTILGDGIPLDPPSSFLCEARNSKVDITWVDPKDKYATPEGEQMEDTDQLVSVWSYTKIVRKEGSQPTSPSDGVTVCTNTTQNQYQSTIFEDTSVTNGTTYYYAAYAYNTAGTYSDGAFSDGITPIEWDPVLANNSWEQIDSACTQGVAQSMWNVGDEKDISVNGTSITLVILSFNHNAIQNGGTAVMSLGNKNLLMLSTSGDFGAGTGWENSVPGKYIRETIPSQFTTDLQSRLQTIRGYSGRKYVWESDISDMDEVSLTRYEYYSKCIGYVTCEITGESYALGYPQYDYYSTAENRIKYYNNLATSYNLAETAACQPSGGGGAKTYIFSINHVGKRRATNIGVFGQFRGTVGIAFVIAIGKSQS